MQPNLKGLRKSTLRYHYRKYETLGNLEEIMHVKYEQSQ